MIKVSHESPLSLMEQSRSYNDYDYALAHLFNHHPEYHQFFKDSLSMGRHVLLDNGAFELGASMDMDKFASAVSELQPTEYIVPDVLENAEATMAKFDHWMDLYRNAPGKKIGVVQGKTYPELVKCYQYMSMHADKIAISFDYSHFLNTALGFNRWEQLMYGRARFINQLMEDEIINYDKPHHLLGCALPQEFKAYKYSEYCFIETLDTSNPVVAAMFGWTYGENGLNSKITDKLADNLDFPLSKIDQNTLKHNLTTFRSFVQP